MTALVPGGAAGFGGRLRAEREALGLTLVELGERASLYGYEVSRLESGKARPTLDDVEALAAAFGMPVALLAGWAAPEAEPGHVPLHVAGLPVMQRLVHRLHCGNVPTRAVPGHPELRACVCGVAVESGLHAEAS